MIKITAKGYLSRSWTESCGKLV